MIQQPMQQVRQHSNRLCLRQKQHHKQGTPEAAQQIIHQQLAMQQEVCHVRVPGPLHHALQLPAGAAGLSDAEQSELEAWGLSISCWQGSAHL